jgi:hypothetical protein
LDSGYSGDATGQTSNVAVSKLRQSARQ